MGVSSSVSDMAKTDGVVGLRVGLFLTNKCNYQCQHCMVDSEVDGDIASDAVIERFLEIIKYNKPTGVCILGGEPLLHFGKVEDLVERIKLTCSNILIYSNGSFLLDTDKRQRVRDMGVNVRISKTDLHKSFWNDNLESYIDESPYIKIEPPMDSMHIFPRGRALSTGVYKDQYCPCSLATEEYDGHHHSNRFLIMMDGSVNMWCPCMSMELANVFEDNVITHDLLVHRERILREYLKSVNMMHDNMLFMCNDVCNSFKVTSKGIYRVDNELMEEFKEEE